MANSQQKAPVIRNGYSPSVRQAHPKSVKSLTEQSHEKACNINSIMARYQKTGLINHINTRQGVYADVSGADFKTAQDLIAECQTEFAELPSSYRDYFANDVSRYLDFMAQEDADDKLRRLFDPEPEPEVNPETVPPKPDSGGTEAPAEETAVT